MRRREFIAGLGAAVASPILWPLAVGAQQPERMRQIGLLQGLAESDPETQARTAAFRLALKALGWTEGRNVSIDYRFGGGDPARVQAYAAELVKAAPDLIVAVSTPAAAALKQATHTIPIVLAVVNDPLDQGFVASLERPGGNITGFSNFEFTMVGKWLELLKEFAPGVRRMALIFNPLTAPYYPVFLRELGTAPARLAIELAAAPVRDEAEIEAVIAALAREPGGGLIAAADPFTITHRALIIALAERHRLPTVYSNRQSVAEGGLLSYGPDQVDIARRSASYVDRILKGEKPADLPVQAPTKYEMAINRKTAKALGLTIPETLLATADEIIQ
jgi:putative tryptophan/tyrosine transport system substrate-binding protein